MKVITAPHPTLRQKARPITKADKKIISFVKNLETTLSGARDPKGVGLAAPQVNKSWRIFATQLKNQTNKESPALHVFINPVIKKHSYKQIFGQKKDEPRLEGCLSIPSFYGPVPRWQWIEIEYQQIANGNLIEQKAKFEDFNARVIQHEYDHLEGILFTDYILEYDLPIYKENKKTKKLEEIEDKSLLKIF
ncbi:MAG: peptide deformylase [Candidatus Woesebacteria bacterium]|jgi:peptide deformylase